MSSKETLSSFIQGAPPGELADVVKDVKALTSETPPEAAFQKYNEEQLATTKLPGASQPVLISKYNKLSDCRYFDTESSTSFEYDHVSQRASNAQSYAPDSPHTDLLKPLLESLATYATEHFTSSSYGVYPYEGKLAILLVSNKYSPTNFWNGRWRSFYLYDPSSTDLTGTIHVNVHYYEDGNVALTTTKPVSISAAGTSAADVQRKIASTERAYQEELNRSFVAMNEQSFKALRRQLPVTRQKVEWEKVGGYRLGSDLRGGGR